MTGHADYPHQPGTLYDCQPCETECNCDPATGFQCLACVILFDDEEA